MNVCGIVFTSIEFKLSWNRTKILELATNNTNSFPAKKNTHTRNLRIEKKLLNTVTTKQGLQKNPMKDRRKEEGGRDVRDQVSKDGGGDTDPSKAIRKAIVLKNERERERSEEFLGTSLSLPPTSQMVSTHSLTHARVVCVSLSLF